MVEQSSKVGAQSPAGHRTKLVGQASKEEPGQEVIAAAHWPLGHRTGVVELQVDKVGQLESEPAQDLSEQRTGA